MAAIIEIAAITSAAMAIQFDLCAAVCACHWCHRGVDVGVEGNTLHHRRAFAHVVFIGAG